MICEIWLDVVVSVFRIVNFRLMELKFGVKGWDGSEGIDEDGKWKFKRVMEGFE